MAGMTASWLRLATGRLAWEVRRAQRRLAYRLGLPGVLALLALAVLLTALWMRESQRDKWTRARDAVAQLPTAGRVETPITEPDGYARLREFDRFLPAHEDIPTAIQDLIALAEANGLVLTRGTYRPQPETQGGYLRYRMTLPVTGHADAILRFMMAALETQATLSLEAVQFKRERSDTLVVETRIQWALLTHLPPAGAPRVAGAGPAR